MILKKLNIKNIRSYENQEIIFPKGSTLLSGDIGSGKTTILLAIEFALFGLQPSQKGASLLKNNKEEGKVILEFEIEGKEIIIERRLKKGKKTISQDYASIIIDNEKFEESVTEIKSKVLTLLNYPQEFSKKTNLLYKFTVYTPQEEMKQIILESGDTRLNTLRHVFGIDKYKRIQENTSTLTIKLREKIRINSALYQDLDELKENLILKEKELIDSKEKLILVEIEYNKSSENKIEKEKDIEEVRSKIDKKKSLESEKSKKQVILSEKQIQITSISNNIKSLQEQIKEIEKLKFSEEEYSSLNQRAEFQKNKESELQKELIEIMGKIQSSESKKSESSILIRKISGLEKCPTCLQEVSEEYKNNMLTNVNQEIQSLEKNLEIITNKKTDIIEKINAVKKLKENFEKQKASLDLLKVKLENIKEKEQNILESENQKKLLEEETYTLNNQIIAFETSIKEYEKYDFIFKEKSGELNEAITNENNLAIKKAEINKEIQFTEERIKENSETITKKESLKNQTEKIKELEYWISQKFLDIVLFTEKQVMITLKDEFSKLFSKWFAILVSDSLTARLDDDFSPIVEQQGYELDYSYLSGGERTAIALAYRLSLNQVINSILSNLKTSNLVILDEPTDGFSAQQLDKIRDVLDQLDIEQLILVSHEPKIESFVDNIIKVKKENGISRIE